MLGCDLVVSNPTAGFVQVKVKTNAPKLYSVSPHCALLVPRDSRTIQSAWGGGGGAAAAAAARRRARRSGSRGAAR